MRDNFLRICLFFFTVIYLALIFNGKAQDSHLNVGIMTGMNLENEMGLIGLSVVESHDESKIVYGVNLITSPENYKVTGKVFFGTSIKNLFIAGAGVSLHDWKISTKHHTKPFVMLMFKPTSYPVNFFINQSLFNKDIPFTNLGIRFTLFRLTSKEGS